MISIARKLASAPFGYPTILLRFAKIFKLTHVLHFPCKSFSPIHREDSHETKTSTSSPRRHRRIHNRPPSRRRVLPLFYPPLHNIAHAQTADTPTPVPTSEQPDGAGAQQLPPIEGKLNPPQYPNMDSNLNRIVEQAQTGQITAQAAAASAPIHREDSVAVTLYITEGYADAIAAYLESNGASPRNIGIDYIEAYIPVSLLAEASQQEGVISVRTIIPPQPAQGVVVSEGAAAHGAPAWHAAGHRGQGVKIGIIDTGFSGFRDLMGSELPSSVEARCYTDIGIFTQNLADCEAEDDPHGTAVTEAAFDIAPEATYYIANTSSWGDLIATVDWMIEHDVDVINQSVGYIWQGPGDGTSPFSNAVFVGVDTAIADGITWVNAAGNEAQSTWFSNFSDTDANGWHNFSRDDECNNAFNPSSGEFEIEAGEEFTAQLRWDDNWFGASRDLDLHLFRVYSFGLSILPVASSEDEQSGGQGDIPREVLSYTPTSTGNYCLAVSHYDGSAPPWIQMQAWGVPSLEYYTVHHSIGNPAESANPGLLAVGAAPWNDTARIEDFSSRGPTPDDRIKPDIVGADGGQSVSYRSTDRPDGNWYGTSQSSPHVAGLAALVKQRFPEYSPQQVAQYLKNNALPRGSVPNNIWGYGFAKLPAVASQPTPVPTPTPTATPITPTVPDDVLNRLSALETLVATLQGLITALDSRIAALEADASIPEPTPTSTPIAPTPTPTPAPGEPPAPTPISTVTPEPTATATPIADACVTPITEDGEITASWDSACPSTNRPLDQDKPDDGNYYARYYTFNLSAPALVTISLTSSEDTFLYLLEGVGRTGAVAHSNDDIALNNYNSQIEQTLQAGSYTIEAATYASGVTGSFTLTVSGIK